MISLLAAVSLAAAPSVAIGDFSRVNVSPELATFAAEHVSQALGERGLKVVTARDIAALVGLERQKELLGCSTDGTSCTTELLQALGADYLLLGTLAKLGGLLQVNLKLLDARSGTTRAAWSDSTRDEADLPRLLSRGAEALGATLVTAAPARPLTAAFWVPLAAGVALLGGAGACFALTEDASGTLGTARTTPLSTTDARALVERGKTTQVLGPVLAGAGAAALATAVIVAVTQTRAPVAVALTPDGAALFVTGSF